MGCTGSPTLSGGIQAEARNKRNNWDHFPEPIQALCLLEGENRSLLLPRSALSGSPRSAHTANRSVWP